MTEHRAAFQAPFALIPIPAVDTVPRDSKPPARAWS